MRNLKVRLCLNKKRTRNSEMRENEKSKVKTNLMI